MNLTTLQKNIMNLSLATILAFSTTACSVNNPSDPDIKDTKNERIIKHKINSIKNKTNHTKPIERIYVDNFVYEKDSINHNIPYKKVSVKIYRGMTLQEFSTKMNIPTVVEHSISQRKISYKGTIRGSRSKVYNTIASITDTFWSYEDGVVKFTRTKNSVFTFPFFSMERLQDIYNTGNQEDSGETNVEVTKDVFDELEIALQTSLDEVIFTGTVTEKWTEKIGDTSSNESNDKALKNKDFSNGTDKSSIENNSIIENFAKSEDSDSSHTDTKIVSNDTGSRIVSQNKRGKGANTDGMKIQPTLKDSDKTDTKDNKSTKLVDNSDSKRENSKAKSNSVKNNTNTKSSKENAVLASNKKDRENTRTRELDFKTTYGGGESKISISKEMGSVFTKLTPSESRRANTIIKKIIQKRFSNLIVIDTYILAVDSEKMKDYSLEFGAMVQNGFVKSAISIANAEMKFGRDSLTEAVSGTPTSGSILSGVLKYFIGNSRGQILSEPKIVTMPNVPARLKDTKYYPYIEPSQLTGAAGNSISYEIKNVEEGIDLTVLPTVLSDNTIFLSLGLNLNQYLGDKVINAGVVGTFNLPMQAPKKLNTTFRIKPGDIIILGGIKSSKTEDNMGSQMSLTTKDLKRKIKSEFMIVAMPRLIKFVEEKDRLKEERAEAKENAEYKKNMKKIMKAAKNKTKIYKNLNLKKI